MSKSSEPVNWNDLTHDEQRQVRKQVGIKEWGEKSEPVWRSKCHASPVYVVSGGEGTSHFNCSRCDKPCDFYDMNEVIHQANLDQKEAYEAAKEALPLPSEPVESLDPYSSLAEILEEAYKLGEHQMRDGCLIPLLAKLEAYLESEKQKARKEALEGLIGPAEPYTEYWTLEDEIRDRLAQALKELRG